MVLYRAEDQDGDSAQLNRPIIRRGNFYGPGRDCNEFWCGLLSLFSVSLPLRRATSSLELQNLPLIRPEDLLSPSTSVTTLGPSVSRVGRLSRSSSYTDVRPIPYISLNICPLQRSSSLTDFGRGNVFLSK